MAKQNKSHAQVFHFNLQGKREEKYDFLNKHSLDSIQWNKLEPNEPNFFLVKKNFDESDKYEKGFKVDELFSVFASGLTTERDSITIHFEESTLKKIIADFLTKEPEEIRKVYNEKPDGRDWKIRTAKEDINKNVGKICNINYRPFDLRKTYFTGKTKGFMAYPRNEVMQHLINNENVALILKRGFDEANSAAVFLTKYISDRRFWTRPGMQGAESVYPLYLYPETNPSTGSGQATQQTIEQTEERTPNLNAEIVDKIAKGLGLTFKREKTTPTPPTEGLLGSALEKRAEFGYITANPKKYKFIKEMRDYLKANPTEAEKVMWEYLRNKKTGHKIRRQHIIDDFITDFVCLRKKVVIEIDGKIHLRQKEYDEIRTLRLNELNYEVIRFTNEEVLADPVKVALKIKSVLDSKANLQNDEENTNIFNKTIAPPLEGSGEVFAPIDILDYIYAVLHSPVYREKYKEFLKIDFPRVPYPKDKKTFWQLVKLGTELRQIHLLEHPTVDKFITTYPVEGDNEVTKVKYEGNKVWINEKEYFGKVPEAAWNFYIGGYQPAQKWLKDRKGRKLNYEDIMHYQKIIVALTQTDKLMQQISTIEIE